MPYFLSLYRIISTIFLVDFVASFQREINGKTSLTHAWKLAKMSIPLRERENVAEQYLVQKKK